MTTVCRLCRQGGSRAKASNCPEGRNFATKLVDWS
jgi:hypothetical protein